MKKTAILTSFVLLALTACTESILDFRNAEISNNKIYELGANKPFSGKVTNVPYFRLPDSRSISDALSLYATATNSQELLKTLKMNGIQNFIAGTDSNSAFLCDIHVKNGELNGNAGCHLRNSNIEIMNFNFQNHQLNGELKIYDINEDKSTSHVVSTTLLDGKLHGEIKIWNKHGKLYVTGHMLNGMRDGEFKFYDNDGSLMNTSMFSNNILQSITFYNPSNNEVLGTLTYNQYGLPVEGISVSYQSINGKRSISTISEYKNLVSDGTMKQYDDNGNFFGDLIYKNGKPWNGLKYQGANQEPIKYTDGKTDEQIALDKEYAEARAFEEEQRKKQEEKMQKEREIAESQFTESDKQHVTDCIEHGTSQYPNENIEDIKDRCYFELDRYKKLTESPN